MNGLQCKAARAMLDLSGKALAKAAGVSGGTVVGIERAGNAPNTFTRQSSVDKVRIALEGMGIVFGPNCGVQHKQGGYVALRGRPTIDCEDTQ
jgi:DNA-binding XRE family transcriptional regulator